PNGTIDRLVFGAGIAPADITVVRSGNHLLFRHANGLDQVTVNNWFAGTQYQIERIEFHDGSLWDAARASASALTALAGTAAADTLTGTANADQITGLEGNDTLDGLAGHDGLDGGLGADTMRGGVGDDVYVVDNVADLVTELVSEGRDAVRSSIAWTLGANIEDLVLTGTAAINGTGNTLDNVLYGNTAANVLAGGAGNDRYYVGAGDSVTEAANAGTDTVVSTATWTLGSNIENLILVGTAAINGTGNTLANVLTGNAAANTLNGGTGADTMLGGAGDDIYTVDNVGDVVTELTNEGTDRVNSSINYTLGANVENLTLTGSTVIHGTGNEVANVITGNSANNTLVGGAGNDTLNGGTGDDTMLGGSGNDTYVVNVATDIVTELANEGIDTVQSAVTWTLGDHVENLTLTGSTAINGTGNALNNVLVGNSAANTLIGGAGNDTLDGGAGSDTMLGGSGDDIYVVNAAGDVTTENVGEGIDTVRSSVTRTLGSELENLTLTGSGAINGTGNALNNILSGNAANNTLAGLAGDDTYDGGAGNDTLTDNSTTSNDVYRWGVGQGNDTINDSGGNDRIEIAAGVTSGQVTLTRSGNHLLVGVSGAADVLTVANWYVGAANKIEEIRLADGSVIAAGTVAPLAVMSTPTPAARMVRLADPAPSAALADDARMLNSAQSLVQAMAQFGAAGAAMDAPWSWPARHEAGPLLAMPY
ncbi:MAG: calcium-binding protein, partial [Burkholderiaceae bacterium]|nr:calcium-binding protein [Burkholderiaceae bacterium]